MATYAHGHTLEDLKKSILAGPNTFIYLVIDLPNGRQKKIVMMGETHSTFTGCEDTDNCFTMIDYIRSLVVASDCLDIFIESAPERDQGYKQTHSVHEKYTMGLTQRPVTLGLVRYFSKSISIFKNVRVHNWDLRFRDNRSYAFMNFYKFLMNNITQEDVSHKITPVMIVGLTKYFLGYNDITQEHFLGILKILNYTPDRETITQLYIFIGKIKDEYKKFEKTEQEYFPDLRDKYLKHLLKIYAKNYLVYFSLLLTDFYVLIRMFRSFGHKKKGACIGNPYSDKIILYGGFLHIHNIASFISSHFEDCIRYRAQSWMKQKFISSTTNTTINMDGYRNFGDFLSWPG